MGVFQWVVDQVTEAFEVLLNEIILPVFNEVKKFFLKIFSTLWNSNYVLFEPGQTEYPGFLQSGIESVVNFFWNPNYSLDTPFDPDDPLKEVLYEGELQAPSFLQVAIQSIRYVADVVLEAIGDVLGALWNADYVLFQPDQNVNQDPGFLQEAIETVAYFFFDPNDNNNDGSPGLIGSIFYDPNDINEDGFNGLIPEVINLLNEVFFELKYMFIYILHAIFPIILSPLNIRVGEYFSLKSSRLKIAGILLMLISSVSLIFVAYLPLLIMFALGFSLWIWGTITKMYAEPGDGIPY